MALRGVPVPLLTLHPYWRECGWVVGVGGLFRFDSWNLSLHCASPPPLFKVLHGVLNVDGSRKVAATMRRDRFGPPLALLELLEALCKNHK